MRTIFAKHAYKAVGKIKYDELQEDLIVLLIKTHHLFTRGVVFPLLFVVLLISCSAPNKQQVSQDFGELFLKEVGNGLQPMIVSVNPGEGDSDNVYQHVRFDIVAVDDVVVKKGWLAGISLRKGHKLYGGEVILLYQKNSGSKWKMTRTDLKRAPSEQPPRTNGE